MSMQTKHEVKHLEVRELCLESVMDVDDQWLEDLRSPEDLLHLNLAGASTIHDCSLSYVLFRAKNLRSLVLDGCLELSSGVYTCADVQVDTSRDLPVWGAKLEENVIFHGSESPTSTMDFPDVADLCVYPTTSPLLMYLKEFSAEATPGLFAKNGLAGLVRMAPNLEKLHLSMCSSILDTSPLAHLHQLQVLDLGWCREVGDDAINAIAQLHQLEELELSGTLVGDEGLARLAGLGNLSVLSLGGCRLSDAGAAEAFQNALYAGTLRKLDLSRCGNVGDEALESLATCGFENLCELDVSFTNVRDLGVQSLRQIRALRSLDLDSCRVTDAAARALSQLGLETLKLADTRVGDATLDILGDGKCSLVTLDLGNTHVTSNGIIRLSRSSSTKTIKYLSLDTPDVTDAAMRHIVKFRSLVALDLFGSRVTDMGLPPLQMLESTLTTLEVCGGGVTNRGARQISRLRLLQSLNVSQNPHLGNEGIAALAKLNHLERLNIAGTGVTGKCISALASMQSLRLVSLHGCRITASDCNKLMAKKPSLMIIGIT